MRGSSHSFYRLRESGALKEEKKAENKTEKLTFVLDWTPNTNHTGRMWPKERDTLKMRAGSGNRTAAGGRCRRPGGVGKSQLGVSFQDTMAPAVAGEDALPNTAIAAVVQHNTSGIISRKGEGMDRPKGLEGKKYATWDAPIEKAM